MERLNWNYDPTPMQDPNSWYPEVVGEAFIDVPEQTTWESAKVREYRNGTFIEWNTPGARLNLSPVPRRHTDRRLAGSDFWCREESGDIGHYGYNLPDVFGVNGGNRDALVGIQTQNGRQIIIQQGLMAIAPRDKKDPPQIIETRDLWSDDPLEIGKNWTLRVVDGADKGKNIHLVNVRSAVLQYLPSDEMMNNSGHWLDELKSLTGFSKGGVSSGEFALPYKAKNMLGPALAKRQYGRTVFPPLQ